MKFRYAFNFILDSAQNLGLDSAIFMLINFAESSAKILDSAIFSDTGFAESSEKIRGIVYFLT